MRLSAAQKISQVSRTPPTIKSFVNGKEVTEQIPATSYTRKFVNPAGYIVRIPLASGRTIGGTVDNPYGNFQRANKIKQGFLPYSECPIAKGYLHAKGETPCEGTNGRPGEFGKVHPTNSFVLIEDDCCPHLTAIIEQRQAAHKTKEDAYQRSAMSSQDKLLEEFKAHFAREVKASSANERNDPGPRVLGGRRHVE